MSEFQFYPGARFKCKGGYEMTLLQHGSQLFAVICDSIQSWCTRRLSQVDGKWTTGYHEYDPVEQLPPLVPVSDEVWQHCQKHGLTNLRVAFGTGDIAGGSNQRGSFRTELIDVAFLRVDPPAPKPQPLTMDHFLDGRTVLESRKNGTMHVVSGVDHAGVSVTPSYSGANYFPFSDVADLFSILVNPTCVPATKEGLCSTN